MLTGSDIQQLGSLPPAERQKLALAPGDDGEESSWRNLFNLRLQVDGQYVFWKTRGGSELVHSFPDDILTTEAFQVRREGMVGTYVGVHTEAGDVYIWDMEAETVNQIIDGAFSTSQQIQFAPNGRFLYMFDYDGSAGKYYDFTNEESRDFLSYNNTYITSHNWLTGEPSEQNIWGFEVGGQIIVFPNKVPTSGQQIYSSDSSDAPSIKPTNHEANSFLYTYNGGDYMVSLDGTEYTQTQFLTFPNNSAPFDFEVEGDQTDPFTIQEYYIPLDESGNPSFRSYIARIDDINEQIIHFEDLNGVPRTAAIGGVSAFGDANLVLPYSPDLDAMVGRPANKQLSDDSSQVQANGDYEFPRIYRQYVVFEMLDDGSMTLPGLPRQIKATPVQIQGEGAMRLSFTITGASDHVLKRFLATTRWQIHPEDCFVPTSENYADSPLFITREIDRNRVFATDNTPDGRMFRPIGEHIPTSAGVPDLFGSGQLSLNSIASFTGSLLAGGYRIDRPTPMPYDTAATATTGNIFLDLTPTTPLDDDIALAFQFEYTDGRRSEIVETEQFLQEGTVVESEVQVCGQVAAHATHEVTTAAASEGDVTIAYEGENVTVDLNPTDHDRTRAVAQAIAQAVSDDPDLRIDATVTTGSEITYTERRFGEEFNGNEVTVTISGGSGDPGIDFDTQSPSLSDGENPEGTTAKGYITPLSNNLDTGSSAQMYFYRQDTESGSNPNQASGGDSLQDIANEIAALVADMSDAGSWNTLVEQRPSDGKWRVFFEIQEPGDTSWNGTEFTLEVFNESLTSYVDIEVSNPNGESQRVSDAPSGQLNEELTTTMSGAVEACSPAEGELFITDNNLGGGETEDHTLTIDDISVGPITITDTDTAEDIADKYMAAIAANRGGDIITDTSKEVFSNGAAVTLIWREWGEVGNGREVSVSGDTDVDVSDIDFSGASNGDTVASAITETVSANRVQIHSLNQLVSKVYILGRTEDGGEATFHPIREVEITDPEAHGMVVELPYTNDEGADMVGDLFPVPPAAQILETIDLENYVNIGTPFQQFQISTQEPITDQSVIRRVMPVDFAADTTVMRYRVMIFTDRNIQVGYLSDQTSTEADRTTRVFESDFEITFAGTRATSREGISDVFGRIIFPTRNGMYSWARSGSPEFLFDVRRYEVSAEETLKDVIYNQDHGEFWFLYPAGEVIAYDTRSGAAHRMDYSGISPLGCGAFFNDILYISSGTDLLTTDIDGVTDDMGADITARAETTHIGNELTQMRLLEVTVGGQQFDCGLDVDLQPERFESDTTTWADHFTADQQLGPKELVMSGASYQIQAMAVMPRLRLSFDATGGGRLSYVILKSIPTDNRGRARV